MIISIHPPHAGRDGIDKSRQTTSGISIHPPHAGRDIRGSIFGLGDVISIHPPHAGRDLTKLAIRYLKRISIHPPHAGRDVLLLIKRLKRLVFQSTRPMRGGTFDVEGSNKKRVISIHPPHAGRDAAKDANSTTDKQFQSTRPMRGGTVQAITNFRIVINFNPPAPCGAGQQSCTKFTPCILAQYTIQRAAKLLFAYQQAHFC